VNQAKAAAAANAPALQGAAKSAAAKAYKAAEGRRIVMQGQIDVLSAQYEEERRRVSSVNVQRTNTIKEFYRDAPAVPADSASAADKRPRVGHSDLSHQNDEAGAKTADVCRRHGVSDATFYKWKAKYGGMEVSDARKLKGLEDENRKLKKLLAEAMLDNAMLKELNSKKW
jgi:putative transposase